MQVRRIAFCLVMVSWLLATPLMAQNPTGTLTGRVTDESGGALPGVTVTATSPALQGTRSTTTRESGDYKLPFLPSGTYRVMYELEGFTSGQREVKVSAAQTTISDVSLNVGAITETIEITSQQAAISETTTSSATVTAEELDALPVLRDLSNAMRLAPGVTNSSFRSSAPVIAGAPSFENLFMVNGVVIQDNVRNTILNLFIEDAIQETTTSVSGISAEYGRFTGGVVNAVTKSGGNRLDGSLRVNFTNEDWEARTPLSDERVDNVNEVLEGTLGGFLLKDHLWYFLAGRDREVSDSAQTDITNITYPTTDAEERYEAKLTVSPNESHSVIGSYLEIDLVRTNTDFGRILDLRSLNANRGDPQEVKSFNYTGILSESFFIEGQYSERDFTIGVGSGGPRDLIEGTLIRNRNNSNRFWAATFCGECPDEERNNVNYLAKGSYFLTTGNAGTHDIVFGYDTFEDIRSVINRQTGSDFTVYATGMVEDAAGNLVLDPATGSYYPVFDSSLSREPWVRWFAVFNEDLARPTSFNTNSFYVNDNWQLNDKWSFNVGFRYDENDGIDSAGVTVSDDSKFSPRLGANYDVKGDGDLVFRATYGTYVAGLANAVADDASPGGAIGSLRYDYAGPPINVGCTPGIDCVSADEALRIIFDWYESQGGVFDLANLDPNAPITAYQNQNDVPGATLQIVGGIKSPSVDELTFGFTKRLGNKGLARVDAIFREWEDFYGDRTTLETGTVDTTTGPADVTLLGNFNNNVEREYRGLITSLRYRPTDRLRLNLSYTLSELEGNFIGETTNSGPVSATTESYPEYREARWNYPNGNLPADQRHTVRAWAVYDLIRSDRHSLNISWLENYFSGNPYSADDTIDPRDFVNNPGYEDPPSSVTYFFSPRGAFTSDNVHRTDLSLNYTFSFNVGGRELEIFVQPEVLNLFNEDAIIDPDDNVNVLADFNPFTETPVEGTHWEKDSDFGNAINENDFQTPRLFRFSVGIRF